MSAARAVGATEPLQVPEFRPANADGEDDLRIDRPASTGSVIDRPAPLPPDWMSGVEVPDLPTGPAADDESWFAVDESRVPGSIQRGVSLALVIILVVVVALVLLGSVTDLGSGLG